MKVCRIAVLLTTGEDGCPSSIKVLPLITTQDQRNPKPGYKLFYKDVHNSASLLVTWGEGIGSNCPGISGTVPDL